MRELDLQEFVDEIYEDSQNNEDAKYIFFLGAGCSKSSGIPLAKELAKEWYEKLEKQKSKFDRFNKDKKILNPNDLDFAKNYFNIFEALFPSPLSQQKEIQRITNDDKVKPSLGYYMLSALMQKPQFNTIVTTNFDNLIQDALIFSGLKRALVITHQDLAKFIDRDNTPLITKIHGDAHIQPFNNNGNTKKVPEPLKSSIQNLFTNAKVLCIGYGGDDESIVDLLSGCNKIDQVYWLNSSKPIKVKLSKWWKSIDTKTYIKEYDFDKIMSLIKLKFNLVEPDFDKRAKELRDSYDKSKEEEQKDIEKIENKTYLDYFMLGYNYSDNGEYDKAIESYKKAIEINPKKDDAYYNMGISYDDNGEYDKAIESYKKAIEINPKKDKTYYNMGIAYSENKQYDKAIESYKKAIEINPKKDDAYYNMGIAYIENKQYDKAIESYKKAIEINPKNDKTYYNMGIAYIENKQYDKAIESYKKAIEINPKKDEAYNNLFELQIIQNLIIDTDLEQKYISLFEKDKDVLFKYELLKILSDIVKGKEIDTNKWLKDYEKQSLTGWSFDELDKWITTKDGEIKDNLLDAIKIFKTKI